MPSRKPATEILATSTKKTIEITQTPESGSLRPSKQANGPEIDALALPVQLEPADAKLDWSAESKVAERPLWEVAALAYDIKPVPASTAEHRKANPLWSKEYKKLLIAMCDRLLPTRADGHIYYDEKKPANGVRIGDKATLKYVRVDVATAAAFVVDSMGRDKLPRGFLEMGEHLAKRYAELCIPPASSVTVDAPLQRKAKSQDDANETKTSNALTVLLYAVVEQQFGWVGGSELSKETVLVKIENCLDRHRLKSTRSMSRVAIEGMLDKGVELAPLRT